MIQFRTGILHPTSQAGKKLWGFVVSPDSAVLSVEGLILWVPMCYKTKACPSQRYCVTPQELLSGKGAHFNIPVFEVIEENERQQRIYTNCYLVAKIANAMLKISGYGIVKTYSHLLSVMATLSEQTMFVNGIAQSYYLPCKDKDRSVEVDIPDATHTRLSPQEFMAFLNKTDLPKKAISQIVGILTENLGQLLYIATERTKNR